MHTDSLPRPTQGDLVDLILQDHRTMEELLRTLRDATADREEALQTLADLMIAHAIAEEELAYPSLKKKTDDVGQHEVDHGHEEHAEGEAAMRELLNCKPGTDNFDERLEKVGELLNHHMMEEETSILNPAREELSDEQRKTLGTLFVTRRNEVLKPGCGSKAAFTARLKDAVEEGHIELKDTPLKSS